MIVRIFEIPKRRPPPQRRLALPWPALRSGFVPHRQRQQVDEPNEEMPARRKETLPIPSQFVPLRGRPIAVEPETDDALFTITRRFLFTGGPEPAAPSTGTPERTFSAPWRGQTFASALRGQTFSAAPRGSVFTRGNQ